MASVEEVYKQIVASDEEKAAFAQAAQTPGGLAAFLAERGCEASAGEVAEFLRGRQGELADDELDSVAGGCNGSEAVTSAFTAGIMCAAAALLSSETGRKTGEKGKILCDDV